MSYLSDLQTVKIQRGAEVVELVGGSFRGVPFFADSHQLTTGRRVAVHEFPGAKDPKNEDMGRTSRSVSLDAYLVGEDARAQMYALLDALEAPGSGVLVHPYLGTKSAACTGVNVSESAGAKRYASLSLSFSLDADPSTTPATSVAQDRKSDTILRASAGQDTAAATFSKTFSLVGAARFVATQCKAATNRLLDGVESARDSMRTAAEFVDQLHQLRANVELTLLTPSEFARRVQLLITSAEGAVLPSNRLTARPLAPRFGGPLSTDITAALSRVQLGEAVRMAQAVYTPVSYPTSPGTRLLATNQEALALLFRCSAALAAVSFLVGARVDSVQDAAQLQAELLAMFDELLELVTDPELFQALQSAQAAALSYLQATAADLSTVETVTPGRTVAAPVLAFERYGSMALASDIVTRNGTPHPGFLPGAVELEVLSA